LARIVGSTEGSLVKILLATCLLLQDDASHQVQELLRKLQSDQIEVREAAGSALAVLGEAALPELTLAAGSSDPDLASRAKKVLEVIRSEIAHRTFEKIEAELIKSTAGKISVTYDWNRRQHGEAKRFQGSGTILQKGGNRFSMALRGLDGDGRKVESLVVYDGSTFLAKGQLWCWTGGVRLDDRVGLNDKLVRIFLRGGAAFGLDCWRNLTYGVETLANPKEFAAIQEEKGQRMLRYKLSSSLEEGCAIDVKLWYDPEHLRIRRRTVEIKGKNTEATLSETYEESDPGTPIPDEEFRIPKEK
jgi:hypothetical protein